MGLSTLVSVSRNVMTLLFSSGVSFSSKISGDRLGRFTRAAGIVKFHHFIQRGFCAIVHIRSAHGYIAQRGCLEGMLHGFELRKNRRRDPDLPSSVRVVETTVGERPAAVAGCARCFRIEKVKSVFGLFRDC